MHNDTIKVANKIITADCIYEILQRMNDDIIKYQQLEKQEAIQNERYEREYQHWTVKDFSGSMSASFNFYDDTTVRVDNYNEIITIYNNRLEEIRNMDVGCSYSYTIMGDGHNEYVHQRIDLLIYEQKMNIDVKLSSADTIMNDLYQMIKDRILTAPPRYDEVIKKKTSITNKIGFAVGFIPATILAFLPIFIESVRKFYGMTFVVYPILVIILAFVIGNTIMASKLGHLYKSIAPEKKYAGYDAKRGSSIYKDDIDKYVEQSEIHIGHNANALRCREEIKELDEKYSHFIPMELLILGVISIVVILIGNFV